MNLLEMILSAQNGGVVDKMAEANGIDSSTAATAIGKLLPGLASGFKNQVAQGGGSLEGLLGMLQGGNHQRYIENPDAIATPAAQFDGNELLAQLLGSKDASRQLAGQVAEETGVETSILKRLLPQVAALAMGALSGNQGQAAASGGSLAGNLAGLGDTQSQSQPGMAGMLASFLDQDKDGSILDDALGLAGKFLGK